MSSDMMLKELIKEFQKTKAGRKTLAFYRKKAVASETDFFEYLQFRSQRFLAESQAKAWLAEKKK